MLSRSPPLEHPGPGKVWNLRSAPELPNPMPFPAFTRSSRRLCHPPGVYAVAPRPAFMRSPGPVFPAPPPASPHPRRSRFKSKREFVKRFKCWCCAVAAQFSAAHGMHAEAGCVRRAPQAHAQDEPRKRGGTWCQPRKRCHPACQEMVRASVSCWSLMTCTSSCWLAFVSTTTDLCTFV